MPPKAPSSTPWSIHAAQSRGRVESPRARACNETRPLQPVLGRWILTLEMENATGSYDIAWKSQ